MKKIIPTLAGIYINLMAYILPSVAARHGFRLFCRPFRTPLKDYQKQFLHSADMFTFEHDGLAIQAYRWGNGAKKILFLHGWESHTFRWKAYIESLSKDEYTVYAMDAPGHGLSEGNFLSVPYYSLAIQQLLGSIGEVYTVVCHSVGSFAMLHAFHQQKELPVAKLILMAPPDEASDFIEFYQQTLKLSDKSVTLILDYFTKVFGNPITHYSTSKFAGDVTIPGLIIHDTDDKETPYRYGVAIHNNWPLSKLVTTSGLGHNLKSKSVIAEVVNFIHENNFEAIMETRD
ncbi:MAG TPA: alpha/beta hydrolase [Cyclobacteriaceae bacterium]